MILHKGWCPTIEKPMESGDGMLVRMNISGDSISAAQAQEIGRLARAHGNGQIDLTSRGNLQIRGVTEASYPALVAALLAAGFTETSRKAKQPAGAEQLPLGVDMVQRRLVLGLLFGRITADALEWLAQQAAQHGDGQILLHGPARAMSLHYAEEMPVAGIVEAAAVHGFITKTDDCRRRIEACSGAPSCSSARGDTRMLALAIAEALPHLSHSLHLSGCAKGCSCAREADVVVVADQGGYHIALNAKASAEPHHRGLDAQGVIALLQQWEAA